MKANVHFMLLKAIMEQMHLHDFYVNEILFRHSRDTSFAWSTGNSMIKAFIPPSALLVGDNTQAPKNTDIIVAELHGKLIVRFFKKNNFTSWLCNAGTRYQEIKITPALNLKIIGVVTCIISVPQSRADE